MGLNRIVRVTDKQEVLDLESLFREYTISLGKEDKNGDLLVSIFTKLNSSGTLLLVAIKDDEPVGFLWAQPVNQSDRGYLRISEIYSKQYIVGIDLFDQAIKWAREGGFSTLKGLVSTERAEGMKRLFKAKEEAILISVEVGNG